MYSVKDVIIGVFFLRLFCAVYLSRVTEVLLFLMLPEADFSNPLLHVLLKDVVMYQVLAPLLQTIIVPDNFNKTIIFMVRG